MRIITLSLILILFIIILPKKRIETIDLNQELLTVSVLGEVKNPQFIKAHPKATIKDILNQIELTPQADITHLELNKPLQDDMVITILSKTKDECISINSNNLEDLIKISGIGIKTAENIIKHREIHGQFKYIEDLMNVKGIGQSKFNKIKDKICL